MRPVPLGGLVTQGGAIMPNGVVITSFGGGLMIITFFCSHSSSRETIGDPYLYTGPVVLKYML